MKITLLIPRQKIDENEALVNVMEDVVNAYGETEQHPVFDEIHFSVSVRDYEALQNALEPKKKVVPFKDFLKATVIPEDRQKLNDALDRGLAMALGGELVDAFGGNVEVRVKK